MTVRTYKLIKAITQLVGAAAGVYAMHLGADPMTSYGLIALVIAGPEAMEALIENTPTPNGDTDE